MKRAILFALLLVAPMTANAQTYARRRVPQGDVTGLEMGIDGGLTVVPGGRLRWYVTLYEVVQRRDLRVSAGSTVRATASFAREAPVAEVTTDPGGRATIEFAIPEDLESSPHLMLEAISPRNVRRVFEVDLSLESRFGVELFVDRDVAPPEGTVIAFGRVVDRASGTPAADHEVVVRANAGGPLGPPTELRTDAAGVFSTSITMPEVGNTASVTATIEGENATVGISVRTPEQERLSVAARPRLSIVTPGGPSITVDVLVRTPEGVPVEGAQIGWQDQANAPEDERVIAHTDAEGRAEILRPVPRWIDEPWADHAWSVRAVHPAFGMREVPVQVRVARQQVFATLAVEGGALVPGLPGRVLVRLTGPDGLPIADRSMELTVPRLGGRLTATTDRDGVAMVEAAVGEPAPDERCGGPTAAAAELTVGAYSESFCLAVDPDATLVVRSPPVETSRRVHVEILRRAIVARAPVVIEALARRGEGWAPIAESTLASRESETDLALPDEIGGEVWLRARPILDGPRQVRGGGTLAWIGPAPAGIAIAADARSARVEGARAEETLAVFALEPERADALIAVLGGRLGSIGAALDAHASEPHVRMLLATATPRDEAVTAVLREGEIVPLPLPEEPARLGLLRDPWRTRARFVRGRIGRIMRAVEDYVASHVPGDLDDVAVREARGHRFNSEILEGALPAAGLGGEGAAALDGEPLDIASLRAMDPAFTYDNVARRITRERLWRLAWMLRQLVRDRQLDRPWARRGDPAQYLVAMLEAHDVSWQETPIREHLFDAWGNAFALRPARGGGRFTFLDAVPGWDLVSAGPDGRLGTGDDLADPFARVLSSGGLYAEAVGEDALLARLNGVALGRATAETLGELFEVPETSFEEESNVVMDARSVPTRMPRAEIGPVAVPPPLEALGAVGPAADGSRTWTLPRERRRYSAVAVRFSASAPPSSARAELVAGAPYAVRVDLPSVMRPGEALSVPLSIVRLTEAPEASVEVSSRGHAIEVALDGTVARITARSPGIARLRIEVAAGGETVWTREAEVRVVPSGQLRARHASALVTGEGQLAVSAPSGSLPWRARLVVVAPRALDSDPQLATVRASHPAPFAWAAALRGEEVDPAQIAELTRSAGADGRGLGTGVEAACALTAWASAEERGAFDIVVRALSSGVSEDLAERAAVLAALAPAAPGVPDGSGDPASALTVQLRNDGWRALATTSDRPAVMARMAAALLLVDRRDAPGLALLERARAALETDAWGRRWVPGDPERAGDGWIGTLALAIAARQAGEDALADELARVASTRMYLASRTGVDGAFWAIAASVYGAFGVDGPERVALVVNGASQSVDLARGWAELPVSSAASVSLASEHPLLVRVESRFVIEPRASSASPLTMSIEGEPGRLGDRSAYELVVEGRGAVGAPIVEIALPGAAQLDDAAIAALRRSDSVRGVDPVDGAGVLRVRLAPLAEGATHRVPLPWRWIASGRTRGLEVTAYDASRPWETSTIERRELNVEAAR